MPICIKASKTFLFADDTAIINNSPLNPKLGETNTDLIQATDWMKSNRVANTVSPEGAEYAPNTTQ